MACGWHQQVPSGGQRWLNPIGLATWPVAQPLISFDGFKRFHGVSLFFLEGLDGSLRIWNVRVLSTELIHGGDT